MLGEVSDSKGKKTKQAIPREERVEVMRRLEAGETQTAIAAEYGVSRQYVSQLRKQYEAEGETALLEDRRGRKKTRRLADDERRWLVDRMKEGVPSDHGLDGLRISEDFEMWTVESLRELSMRQFGFMPNKGDARKVLDHGVPWDPDRRMEPMKPLDELPRKPRAVATKEEQDDWDALEVDEEELARIRKRIEEGRPVLPAYAEPSGPGVRTGKNRGSKAGQAKKKRRKKGKKGRR